VKPKGWHWPNGVDVVLSKREKHIGLATIALVAVVGLYGLVLSPYLDRRQAVAQDLDRATQQLADANVLFDRQAQLQKIWRQMQQGGLSADESRAESQAQHALVDWAQWAGVALDTRGPGRPTQEDKFQVISFNITGTGSTAAITRLLWALETATIPIRVNDMQITARREGTDDLMIRFSMSTLAMPSPSQSKGGHS